MQACKLSRSLANVRCSKSCIATRLQLPMLDRSVFPVQGLIAVSGHAIIPCFKFAWVKNSCQVFRHTILLGGNASELTFTDCLVSDLSSVLSSLDGFSSTLKLICSGHLCQQILGMVCRGFRQGVQCCHQHVFHIYNISDILWNSCMHKWFLMNR